MKHIIIFLLVAVSIQQAVTAQPDSTTAVKKPKIFYANVIATDGAILKGLFYQATDSSIVLQTGNKRSNKSLASLSADQISSLSVNRKNSVGRGILWGALIGAGTGSLTVLLTSSSKFLIEATTTIAGIAGGIAGGMIGGIAGALAKKKFIIGGKKEKYINARRELMKKAMIQ
ncbi:MAG: hypothetical protein SFU87_15065 [Chitinophagaceae bacterium]|nr:hypothetical protein [Chitinophagaceae bacterium]